MVDVSETRYARNGPVDIAYQVVGGEPVTTAYISPGMSHLEVAWEHPPYAEALSRIASFGGLVLYDMRGTGLSDRTVPTPTVDENVADLMTVLDAIGAERANLFGLVDGAAVALAAAAMHPERVGKVAVFQGFAKVVDEGFAFDDDGGGFADRATAMEALWGSDDLAALIAPSRAEDPGFLRWFSRMNRAAMSPSGAASWLDQMARIDIRDRLADIRAPVLVLVRPGARLVKPEHSRYLTDHLRRARLVEFPGEDVGLTTGGTERELAEVQEFFTGTRSAPRPERALATVMFSDIVDSTRRASELGDTAWRELLARHDERTRSCVEDHGGRVVKSTGDGALATFDDPERAIGAAGDLGTALADTGIELRAGIHTGQVEIVGDDVAGVAVHLASRVADLAEPGEICVSGTVRDLLLGSAVEFVDRGLHELKGIPGQWAVLAVAEDGH